jgi:hypothetical protein
MTTPAANSGARVALGAAFVALPAAAGAGVGALVGGRSHRVAGAIVGGILGGLFGGPLLVIAALSSSPEQAP